jgi:DNA-binding NtrC family response regulator
LPLRPETSLSAHEMWGRRMAEADVPLAEAVRIFEVAYLASAMIRAHGVKAEAARIAGMRRETLYRRLFWTGHMRGPIPQEEIDL